MAVQSPECMSCLYTVHERMILHEDYNVSTLPDYAVGVELDIRVPQFGPRFCRTSQCMPCALRPFWRVLVWIDWTGILLH